MSDARGDPFFETGVAPGSGQPAAGDEDPEALRRLYDASPRGSVREPLLGDKPGQRQREKSQVQRADANFQYTMAGMLICLLLHVSILTARLDAMGMASWPIGVDFLPVFALSLFLYLAAANFATSKISADATVSRAVVLAIGFLGAATTLMLSVFVCLRVSGTVHWDWTMVLLPLWALVFLSQFFLCFTIPGIVKAKKVKEFSVVFFSIWMLALTLLLTCLKLDNYLPIIRWGAILAPIVLAIILQMILFEKDFVNISSGLVAILCLLLLGLRLDKTVFFPWTLILSPVIFLLVLVIAQLLIPSKQPAASQQPVAAMASV
eukprot:gnl/TRDRNA2_/TRDRNA2_130757_c0_seq1.p1 gnl/TRDRNA2_/TRDRNA2_130757_c0~~gnl/TRDRNA2_/TRDRNA2_130757_c0_seq1.p1  ORF type:complete len:321 (+),score=41.10 gnl/TRDRNA2_/TRDRNA2_130757_c0_seq1:45-1007(+)